MAASGHGTDDNYDDTGGPPGGQSRLISLKGGAGDTSEDTAASALAQSFDAFYREHSETVRRALCLALGEAELGTEAADEAMARACERWSTIAGYENPTGWTYRVGLNWGISRQRRRRFRDRRPVPDQGVLPVPGDPDLATALAQLSPDNRAVVVCRYYLDWSVRQTADALGLAAGTVKSRLSRSLDTLKHQLGDRHV